MTVSKLSVRGFRCFDRYDLDFDPEVTLIAGANGSGKTSLLEALHVASRLRSFRTATLTDLIKEGAPAFSLRATVDTDELHVAHSEDDQVSEINGQGPATRWQLLEALPLVTITEDDLEIIQGYPEARRTFMDQASVLLKYPHAAAALSKHYQICRRRSALLKDQRAWNKQSYEIITEQLWRATAYIRAMRQATMQQLEQKMQLLLHKILPEESCTFRYSVGAREEGIVTYEEWCAQQEHDERRLGRTLMGSQFDELEIEVGGRTARRFASRGMQKLLAVLLKVAQAQLITQESDVASSELCRDKSNVATLCRDKRGTLVLDDIMADFDENRLQRLLTTLFEANLQLIFTIPQYDIEHIANQSLFSKGSLVRL